MAQTGQYRLIARISGDDRVATFRARRTDGVPVLIHQLAAGQDHSEALRLAMSYMLQNPTDKGGRILDLFEASGSTHLVTVDETVCVALKDWLQWESSQNEPRIAIIPEEPPPAPVPPAEATKEMRYPASEAAPTMILQPPEESTGIIQSPAGIEPPSPPPAMSESSISSPVLPDSTSPVMPPPESGFKLLPFLISFLVVLALFLLAVVMIRGIN